MGEILSSILIIVIVVMAIMAVVSTIAIRAIIKYIAKCNANAFHYDELAWKIAQQIKKSNKE